MSASESQFLMSRPCTERLQSSQVFPGLQCQYYSGENNNIIMSKQSKYVPQSYSQLHSTQIMKSISCCRSN